MDVDDVGAEATKELNQRPPRFTVPDHLDGHECSTEERPRPNIVTEPFKALHLVTVSLQCCAFLIGDAVLAAGCSRAVPIVNDNHSHEARARSKRRDHTGEAKSDAAAARSKIYGDASPSPTSVYEAIVQ